MDNKLSELSKPVAEVLSSRSGNDTSTIDKALPAGTKVYTVPPAPAYPEILPCAVRLMPGVIFGEGVRTSIMLDGLRRREEHNAEMAAMTPEQKDEQSAAIKALFSRMTPPAPAVSDSRDAFESTWADVMNGNKPARSAVEGQDYAGGAAEFAWKWWQRAAMLAQPVSQGCKLPDNVREALTLALQAMEFMGDTLNNIDAVCTEDVEYVTPAFTAVRGLLAAAPEGGNEK